MKVMYIDCSMGAAGDMLMASLLEVCPKPDEFIKKINNLNIPKVKVESRKVTKAGIVGTHIDVKINGIEENEEIYHNHHNHDEHIHEHIGHHHNHDEHFHQHKEGESHHHEHTNMKKIQDIVNSLDLKENVKKNVIGVYNIIAEAESQVHGKTIQDIHFHEVGTMDAVADIVGVCMLIDEIGADKIIASPIHVGYGTVKCTHGILPVPAPATANILKGIPIYSANIKGELCTPTGAALLKYFVDEFGKMPMMSVSKIGYGMGTKDFETANCLRIMLGDAEIQNKSIIELSCNIDDMTAEDLSFACEKIRESGAVEVFTTAISMKKNRMGVLINCLCKEEKKEQVISAIFKYTSTIGIREYICNRYELDREEKKVATEFGNVNVKYSSGYGAKKYKIEHDDIEKIAIENNLAISEVKIAIEKQL